MRVLDIRSLALTAAILATLAAGGCASAPRPYRDPALAFAAPNVDEIAILASAQKFVGQQPSASVSVKGRAFVLDCVGAVCAIYYDSAWTWPRTSPPTRGTESAVSIGA